MTYVPNMIHICPNNFVPGFSVHIIYKSDFNEPFDLCAIPPLCSYRSF